jgi:hypothetical protein
MGDWVVVGVDQDVCWVSSKTSTPFRGRDLILRPPDGQAYADVSLEQRGWRVVRGRRDSYSNADGRPYDRSCIGRAFRKAARAAGLKP